MIHGEAINVHFFFCIFLSNILGYVSANKIGRFLIFMKIMRIIRSIDLPPASINGAVFRSIRTRRGIRGGGGVIFRYHIF